MKFIFMLIISSLLTLNAIQIKDPYKDIIYMKLDNGLQVYILSDKKSTNTKIELSVLVGTNVENDDNYGISHLTEHMVFRDQRVPHHDYLDYIKEEGATSVNGYTRRYETGYKALIDSNKSYWLVKTFAQMIFDKDITEEDLETEKGAVQTEIGNLAWGEKFIWDIKLLLEKLAPEKKDFYEEEFSMEKLKVLPVYYLDKINNQYFNMADVMKHYNDYYYPGNMILKIAGNFDAMIMKKHVKEYYGKIKIKGTKKAVKPVNNPKLNNKAYRSFIEGEKGFFAYIGSKYILDDYKKFIILDAYSSNIALRLKQKLRNSLGQTYSVYSDGFGYEKAQVVRIFLDGLHKDFENNIEIANKMIKDDMKNISNETINEALKTYSKYYTSVEHDAKSLMVLIDTAQYIRENHNIKKTSVEVFNEITHEDFRKVIKETFTKENSYRIIYREYYYFPYDTLVMLISGIIFLLALYFNLGYIDRKQKKLKFAYRQVVIQRRLSNPFLGFFYIIGIFFISMYFWEWAKYLFFKYVMGKAFFEYTFDVPYSYIWGVAEIIISTTILLLFCRYMFSYWAKLEATPDVLCLVGHRVKAIAKKDILEIEVEPWNIIKSFKCFGISILFWKPLLKIVLKNGKVYYLRSKNAKHLEEDLKKWYGDKDKTAS